MRQGKPSESLFMASAKGFARMMAIVVAFFATGPVYNATIGWVIDFSIAQYGYDVVQFVKFAWWLIVGGGIYFLCQMTVATALMGGAGFLATKIF